MHYETMADDIVKIEIPLPKTPLRITNSYYIRSGERNLLVDTGFNHAECLDAMRRAWTDLGIDADKTDLFITHMHADHCGLVRHLASPRSRIFMSRADGLVAADCQNDGYWEKLRRFFHFSGLVAGGHVDAVGEHPGFSLAPESGADITFLDDGRELAVGRRRFRAVLTPGHTAGHMCLFEPDEKILFSGDHILGRITPNITLVDTSRDVLADYLASLDKLAELDVKIVFPGHRQAIADCRARVAELKEHHRRRLDEVMDIVGGRRADIVEVARSMRWSLTIRDWREYPPAQKLFSAGEAFAHLFHLVEQNQLRIDTTGDIYMFEKV